GPVHSALPLLLRAAGSFQVYLASVSSRCNSGANFGVLARMLLPTGGRLVAGGSWLSLEVPYVARPLRPAGPLRPGAVGRAGVRSGAGAARYPPGRRCAVPARACRPGPAPPADRHARSPLHAGRGPPAP